MIDPRYVIFKLKLYQFVQISKLIVGELHGIGDLLSIEIAASHLDTIMKFLSFSSVQLLKKFRCF